jgi:hypothetical protein
MLSGPANALLIGNGDVFSIGWSVDLSGVPTNNLTATSTWTVSSYTMDSIVLDISISNTTILDPGTLDNAAITSFGFGVMPNVTATLSSAGSVFDSVGSGSGPQQNFPGGFGGIDVCLFADGCSGGSVNNGLQAGASDSLQVTLSGRFSERTDLLFFPVKFQTSVGSFEPGGSMVSVPEPGTLGLLCAGILGFFVSRKRAATA